MWSEPSQLPNLTILYILLIPLHLPPVRLVLLGAAAALHGDLHALVAVGRLHLGGQGDREGQGDAHVSVEVDILHPVLVHELLVVGGQVGGQGQGQEGQEGQHSPRAGGLTGQEAGGHWPGGAGGRI